MGGSSTTPMRLIVAAVLCAISVGASAATVGRAHEQPPDFDPGRSGEIPFARLQETAQDPPAHGPPLQVRVAATPEIARQRGWYADFQCATLRAGDLLDAALGRGLRVRDRVAWSDAPTADGLRALRSHLIRNVDHGGADLVVGLVLATGRAQPDTIREDGLAAYSQGYVVLRLGAPLCASGNLMAHEIAHVFGGIHRRGEGNLMDPLAPGTRVDELNAVLFALHRKRMIRQQEPPLRGEMLRMMWGMTSADIDAADTWLKVGALAAYMGKPDAACEHYAHALTLQPELRTAWVNIGHARLQLGEFDAAERAYATALELAPDDGLVHNNLAVIYLSIGQPQRAEASMQRALELGYEVPDGLRAAIRDAIGGGGRDRGQEVASR